MCVAERGVPGRVYFFLEAGKERGRRRPFLVGRPRVLVIAFTVQTTGVVRQESTPGLFCGIVLTPAFLCSCLLNLLSSFPSRTADS